MMPADGDGMDIDAAVRDRAIEWFVRLASGDASDQDRDASEQWRRAQPHHEQAWRRLEQLGEKLQGSAMRVPPPVARATLRAAVSNGISRRRALKALAGVGTIGISAWTLRDQPFLQRAFADFSTRTGEQRAVTLADGTQLLLNTRTAIDVAFNAHQRRIALRSGEIQVTTARDPSRRPFVVVTQDGTLTPVGTVFTVRRHEGDRSTRIAVREGVVEIRPQRSDRLIVVHAGQQTDFTAESIQAPTPMDEAASSWTDGMLTAENMRLGDFIAELDRYCHGVLRCDPTVAELRLTGAYPLKDTDRILLALEQTLPVRVTARNRYWVSVTAR